jgi:hypothetical protein
MNLFARFVFWTSITDIGRRFESFTFCGIEMIANGFTVIFPAEFTSVPTGVD